MDQPTPSPGRVSSTTKTLARRLLTIGGNRLELLAVEVQEERERLLQILLLALSMAGFGLMATMTLTAVVVLAFWSCSPLAVLLILSVAYGMVATFFCLKINRLTGQWESFPATLDQIRKDRECLEKTLQ